MDEIKRHIDSLSGYDTKTQIIVHSYRQLYPRLYSYALKILHDKEFAADMVQDAFILLFKNRARIDFSSSLTSYLYRTVYSNCMMALRHGKVELGYRSEKMKEFYMNEMIVEPDVEMNLYNQECMKAINEAIANLPSKCREVFILSKIEGLKNKEIANKLNITVKMVEAHMTLAYSKLRVDLKKLLFMLVFLFFI